jgi:hypothetical protein
MSFTFKPVKGNASEIAAELQSESQHTREDEVLPVVTQAIDNIVNSLGGYLSVDASGHINAAQGEPGDTIAIRIVSLSAPESPTPAEVAPIAPESTPVLTSEEALGATTAQRAPEGSVAPPAGTETENGTPGITSAPVENPTTPPGGGTPTQDSTENTESVPTEDVPNDGPEVTTTVPSGSENSPTEVAGENVAQTPAPAETSPVEDTVVETPAVVPTVVETAETTETAPVEDSSPESGQQAA